MNPAVVNNSGIIAILINFMFILVTANVQSKSYAVVIDAGSSGSRVRVYHWNTITHENEIPNIEEICNHKIKPGISDLSDDYEQLEKHITDLIDYANNEVPEEKAEHTPLYLMATAGMRLLNEEKAKNTMDKIDSFFKELTNPFHYESPNTRILSGEEEGAYAWIAVNYLSGFFEEDSDYDVDESIGVLECGGASTQIAFLSESDILANKFPFEIGGVHYSLYVHSYLYYGYNYPLKWTNSYLARSNEGNNIDNPCMLIGDQINDTDSFEDRKITFHGTSDPENCSKIIDSYVYKALGYRCYPKPCAIGPIYQPEISEDMNFYAIGAFKYVPKDLKLLSDDDITVAPNELLEKAKEYCKHTLDEAIEEGIRKDFASPVCVMGLYAHLLFTKAYGFNGDTEKIEFRKKVNEQSPDWSLGAVLYEISKKEIACYQIHAESVTGGDNRCSSNKFIFLFIFLSSFISFFNSIFKVSNLEI